MAAFDHCLVNYDRLRRRKKSFIAQSWILDSQGFEQIRLNGEYAFSAQEYADQSQKLAANGSLAAVVTRDYPTTPPTLAKTGLSVRHHQERTIANYDELRSLLPLFVMPVLHGTTPDEYVEHLQQYGDRFAPDHYIGVGSLKQFAGQSARQQVAKVLAILKAIKAEAPGLRIHGFGLGLQIVRDAQIRELLESADSQAWSFAARREGRNQHHVSEPKAYAAKIGRPVQSALFELLPSSVKPTRWIKLSLLIELIQNCLDPACLRQQARYLVVAEEVLQSAYQVVPRLEDEDDLWYSFRTLFWQGLVYDDSLGPCGNSQDANQFFDLLGFGAAIADPVSFLLYAVRDRRWDVVKSIINQEWNLEWTC